MPMHFMYTVVVLSLYTVYSIKPIMMYSRAATSAEVHRFNAQCSTISSSYFSVSFHHSICPSLCCGLWNTVVSISGPTSCFLQKQEHQRTWKGSLPGYDRDVLFTGHLSEQIITLLAAVPLESMEWPDSDSSSFQKDIFPFALQCNIMPILSCRR